MRPSETAGASRRQAILDAVAEEEARLSRLKAEEEDARARLALLQAELASLSSNPQIVVGSPPRPAAATAPQTPAEKVRLFRSLFRGRVDVFPTRFVSKRTGKPGYTPACRNKFVRGVCELPRVKCGECPSQAFLPFDDAAILAHLTGRHVMGVYPLLQDETCWFLAVDFDKSTWTEDVTAFVETAVTRACPQPLNDRDRGTEPMSGSSSPLRSARPRREKWVATSSHRRCRGAMSLEWIHMIDSSPARTRCLAAASAV